MRQAIVNCAGQGFDEVLGRPCDKEASPEMIALHLDDGVVPVRTTAGMPTHVLLFERDVG
ncbi:MAG: hypothetical protein EP330_08145 [Deltaproteobacteria bacterium]|nr:MAG: hypothetical protein EP330_08145 [Deltaproteobacteria bacterium]